MNVRNSTTVKQKSFYQNTIRLFELVDLERVSGHHSNDLGGFARQGYCLLSGK